jgi:hypothetical protein
MTFGEMERAKELVAKHLKRLKYLSRSSEAGFVDNETAWQVIIDAISIGSAIASGNDIELTDDGVRVIVKGEK